MPETMGIGRSVTTAKGIKPVSAAAIVLEKFKAGHVTSSSKKKVNDEREIEWFPSRDFFVSFDH
jgi:hypothetical protein